MKKLLATRSLPRALPLTMAAALLALGVGNVALAAAPRGFGGGARAGFGMGARAGARAFAGRELAGRGFAGRGFPDRGRRFGPYYGRRGWGPGWGWGFGLGWYLPVLPLYYSTFWWDGVPYYYADNDYYAWNPSVAQYEAVVPPPGVTQQTQAGAASARESSKLFAYPKNGQSAAQQATDKQQCRTWARSQVGAVPGDSAAPQSSDRARSAPDRPSAGAPGGEATALSALQEAAAASATAPPAGPPDVESTTPAAAERGAGAEGAARAAILRAETACLTGRGYSVR